MKYNYSLLLLLCVLICILTGCKSAETGNSEQTASAVETQAARPVLDWRTDSWKFDTLSATNHSLYITGYVQDFEYDTNEYIVSGSSFYCLKGNFYRFDRLERSYVLNEQEVNKVEYYLNCYDTETGEVWHREIPFPTLKEYKEYEVGLRKLDMVSEEEYALFLSVYGLENEVIAYPVVHMNLYGKQLSVIDLYPAMRENDIDILPSYAYTRLYADQRGYHYLLPDHHCLNGLEPGRIMVLDAEGNLAGIIGSEERDAAVNYVMKDPDGNAMFEVYTPGEGSIQLIGYNPAVGEKLYSQVQLEPETPKAMSEDGYLYYCTKDGRLYRWDLYTGTREYCINYQELGIDSFTSTLYMVIGGNGQPLLLSDHIGNANIYQLGTESENAKNSIRMVSLVKDSQYVSGCAIDYSMNHPNYFIRLDKPDVEGLTYDEADQVLENYRTRALADLVAGKGADIYYVTAEDMEVLYEKGVLADLSDVLPQEYVDAIFPGALGCGIIDGKQIGLSPMGYVTVVMADNSLWSGERWNWDEAMAVKETNPDRNQLLILRLTHSRSLGSGMTAIRELYLRYLTETPFLDIDTGICNFDTSRFIHLLEMLKDMEPGTYGDDAVQDQKAVAFMEDIWDFAQFAVMMSEYEGQYHLVGYPTVNSQGNYWTCDYYVVVNQNTMYLEQIKEYLISLFDYSNQIGNEGAVRNDLLEGNIHYNEFNPFSPLMWGPYLIPEKPDGPPGTTWDQEYMDLLNSAVPYRNSIGAVENIILEELDSYFSGDKDAQTVADLIQNRVQLYLNEQK